MPSRGRKRPLRMSKPEGPGVRAVRKGADRVKREKTTFTTLGCRAGVVRKINHEINLSLDVRDFKGRAGMPWLIMAANPHLSINDLLAAMAAFGYERTRSWVSRRRWIFLDPADVRTAGGVRNADGQEARAYRIMGQHPHVSARELTRILRKSGIQRGKDWVLKNRVG